jgi:hypothetical protein
MRVTPLRTTFDLNSFNGSWPTPASYTKRGNEVEVDHVPPRCAGPRVSALARTAPHRRRARSPQVDQLQAVEEPRDLGLAAQVLSGLRAYSSGALIGARRVTS